MYRVTGKYKKISVKKDIYKLDVVGPVDNRPFRNYLHHIVRKKYVTCDM